MAGLSASAWGVFEQVYKLALSEWLVVCRLIFCEALPQPQNNAKM